MALADLHTHDSSTLEIRLNDPDRRNALGLAMFDALIEALRSASERDEVASVLVTGADPAFCAGFDLGSAVERPELMAEFIERLSATNRLIRRLPQVTIAVVQGAAIAGGCALLGACDFIFVEPSAKLGYPVHRIGVSPAVTIPTLKNRMLAGPMRALLMSGRIIDGREAVQIGLATHLAESNETLETEARRFAQTFANKGRHALRVTKAWLSELDGSLEDEPFDATVHGSTHLATEDEAITLLRDFWAKRKG